MSSVPGDTLKTCSSSSRKSQQGYLVFTDLLVTHLPHTLHKRSSTSQCSILELFLEIAVATLIIGICYTKKYVLDALFSSDKKKARDTLTVLSASNGIHLPTEMTVILVKTSCLARIHFPKVHWLPLSQLASYNS